jgi:hypothetical protein
VAHHLFVIHGMGTFNDGWTEKGKPSLQNRIKGLFALYPGTAPEVDGVEIEEINYSDVFDKWRKLWEKNAKDAAKVVKAFDLADDVAGKLVKLADAATGDKFVRTHVLDVVLYRFMRIISEQVILEVMKRLSKRIKEIRDREGRLRYSIIGHSLGTVVAYEAFHAAMTHNPALPPSDRPNSVFLVSNVVVPLWKRGDGPGKDVYAPEMAPNLEMNDGWCFILNNINHRLDPASRLGPFDPPDAWFAPGVDRDLVYNDIWLPEGDVQQLDIHDLWHYLSHPLVHVPLLRQLVSPGAITDEQCSKQLERWRAQVKQNVQKAAATKIGELLLKLDQDAFNQIALLVAAQEVFKGE